MVVRAQKMRSLQLGCVGIWLQVEYTVAAGCRLNLLPLPAGTVAQGDLPPSSTRHTLLTLANRTALQSIRT
jgi:hypothetical protein